MPFPLKQHFINAENIIDNNFGEPIKILPYREAAHLEPAQPDPARPVITDAIGVVIGKATLLNDTLVSANRAHADLLVSVQDKYIGATKQGDHIILLGRHATKQYEINYMELGTNDRTVMHLIRIKP
jgi:hypothetical protein